MLVILIMIKVIKKENDTDGEKEECAMKRKKKDKGEILETEEKTVKENRLEYR